MLLTGWLPLSSAPVGLTHATAAVQWWGATVSEEHKDSGEAGTSHWNILCDNPLFPFSPANLQSVLAHPPIAKGYTYVISAVCGAQLRRVRDFCSGDSPGRLHHAECVLHSIRRCRAHSSAAYQKVASLHHMNENAEPCAAGCLRDLKEQTLLVWRVEGEDWEPTPESDDDEDVDSALATIDMRELGAISREAEARLGCSVEEAALQVRILRHTVAMHAGPFTAITSFVLPLPP